MSSTAAARRARMQYLDATARQIRDEAPATAAAMQLAHNKLLVKEQRGQDLLYSRRPEICLACGNLFDLQNQSSEAGMSDEQVKADSTKQSKAAKRRARSQLATRRSFLKAHGMDETASTKASRLETHLKCSRCHRITHLKPKSSRAASNSHSIKQGEVAATQQVSKPAINSVSNASRLPTTNSGQKRAKARRKGGLQAILAKTKAASSANTTLDLMDFMSTE